MNIGWLFPDGSFWNCEYGMHLSAADDICEHFGIDVRNTEYELECRGFVKITLVDGLYYIYLDDRAHFTFEQYQWIKNKINDNPDEWHHFAHRAIAQSNI